MIKQIFYSKRKYNFSSFYFCFTCLIIFSIIFSYLIFLTSSAHSHPEWAPPVISIVITPVLILIFIQMRIYDPIKWKKEEIKKKAEILFVLKGLEGRVNLKKIHESWLKIHTPRSDKVLPYYPSRLKTLELRVRDLISLLFELRQEGQLSFKYDVNNGDLLLNESVKYSLYKNIKINLKVPKRKKTLSLLQKKASDLEYCIYCGHEKTDNDIFCEYCGSTLFY